MTNVHTDTPPTHIEVGADIEEVISEDEFYHMMTKDPTWWHEFTFVGDVLIDTSDVPQWKVEEHDIRGTRVAHYTIQRTWYVLARRTYTWA